MLPPYPARNRMVLRRRFLIVFLLMFVASALPADAPANDRPEDILSFLNQTIVWYRMLGSQQQLVTEPSDSVFLSDNRQIADQVVQLSFEFARTESQQLAGQSAGNKTDVQNQPNPSQYQNLVSALEKTKQKIDDEQKELDSFKQQLAKATGKKRAVLQASVAESQDELELLKARYDTLQNFLQFSSGMSAWAGPKGLRA